MKQTDFDIAVIGLGHAGSTFARLIDKKYRVIVINEKKKPSTSLKKPVEGFFHRMLKRFLLYQYLP